MGLTPYGNPSYSEIIKKYLIDIKEDGSFKLNQEYFSYATDLVMTSPKFENIFQTKKRNSKDEMLNIHKDIAASIQVVTEEIVYKISKTAKKITNSDNLCLAGCYLIALQMEKFIKIKFLIIFGFNLLREMPGDL